MVVLILFSVKTHKKHVANYNKRLDSVVVAEAPNRRLTETSTTQTSCAKIREQLNVGTTALQEKLATLTCAGSKSLVFKKGFFVLFSFIY